MTDGLRLRLLGGLRITLGESVVDAFTSKKTLALLAYLAITGRAHSRESLSALLWGDWPEDQARASLRTVLWDLRQHLPSYVTADRHTISYNPDASCWVDVLALREATEDVLRRFDGAGQPREHSALLTDTEVSALETTVSLYRGDLMAGFFVSDAPEFEDWMLGERERVRNLILGTLHRLLVHYKRVGAYRRGIDAASRLLAIAPWQEEVHRELMRLLALDGQRTEALVQYDTCLKMLAAELGVEPTMETRLLYRQIRAGRPLDEEGATRGPSGPECAAPPHRPVTPDENLIGRDEEMAALKQMLSEPDGGPVTLIGPEGVGKSSLARSAAAQVAPMFDGRVRYISLGTDGPSVTQWNHGEDRDHEAPRPAVPEPGLPLRIARAFGLTLSAPTPEVELVDYLRHREVLVVLDDLAVSSVRVGFVRDILDSAPYVKLLLVAEAPVGVEGEQVLKLGGLPVPASMAHGGSRRDRAENLMAYDGVRLFVERVERVYPDFELSGANAHDVGAICGTVAGLPLAITLLTPWVEELPVREIADSIDYRLNNMGRGDGQEPEASRVLEAVFLHAWDRVSSAERAALSDLALLPGEFGAEAASEIIGISSAFLRGFVKKGLLRSCGSSRYECHPAVRRLAIAASEAQESGYHFAGQRVGAQLLRERYRTYYVNLLVSRMSDSGSEAGHAKCAEIQREWHHTRCAWYGAVAEADVELLQRGLSGLVDVFLIQGWYQEGVELLEDTLRTVESLAAADPRYDPMIDGLLVALARLYNAQRLPEAARRSAQRVIDRGRNGDIGSVSGRPGAVVEAVAHRECGRALQMQGDLQAAIGHLSHALSLTTDVEALDIRASTLLQLATAEIDAGELGIAWDHLNEARWLYQSREDGRGQAQALISLVLAATLRWDNEAARSHAREALVLSETLGDRTLESAVYARLGRLANAREDYARARTHCERALSISRQVINPELETEALTELAVAHLGEGKKEEAWRRSLLAVELARTSRGATGLVEALLLCGHVFTDLGMAEEARDVYKEARQLQASLGTGGRFIECVAGLARATLAAGDSPTAKCLVEQILPNLGDGDLVGVRDPMRVFLACYQVLQTVGDSRAFDVLARAAQIYKDAPSDEMLGAGT